VEHFRAVRNRLAPGGLFCQWLPLHQLDLGTLRSIVQSYLEVYPEGWAMLATNSLDTPVVGLVAHADARGFDIAHLRQRLAHAAMPRGPAEFGIADDLALMGGFIAGPQALRRFAGTAPLNTDDHPVVAYRAPRITYVPDSLPRDRLIALLQQVEIRPQELVTTRDVPWDARLAAYWSARDQFVPARTFVLPMIRCCGWRQRWGRAIPPPRARSWRICNRCSPRVRKQRKSCARLPLLLDNFVLSANQILFTAKAQRTQRKAKRITEGRM
jgi:spermidine synthase